MTRKRLTFLTVTVLAILGAGAVAAYAVLKPAPFTNRLAEWTQVALSGELPQVDGNGRLVRYPGREAVACPPQDARMAVLLLIGQSNTGNHGARRYASAHGERIVSRFAGDCYVAGSPLLGTTGKWGESWTLLANKMIEAGLAGRVVLAPSGIGGTSISRWKKGGDLNALMLEAVKDARSAYRITHVLWHQGENDFASRTPSEAYRDRFLSLVQSLRDGGVDAPVFASVSSRCAEGWTPENTVVAAQRALPDAGRGIYAGVDTDALIGLEDRFDGCHFSATGQEKFAAAWLEILRRHPLR